MGVFSSAAEEEEEDGGGGVVPGACSIGTEAVGRFSAGEAMASASGMSFSSIGAASSANNSTFYREMEILPQKGVIKYNDGRDEMLLTKNEMTIFMCLLAKKDRIVSRDELMTELWNNEEYLNDNALTVNISRLRARFKDIGIEDVIETRKGQGYILV